LGHCPVTHPAACVKLLLNNSSCTIPQVTKPLVAATAVTVSGSILEPADDDSTSILSLGKEGEEGEKILKSRALRWKGHVDLLVYCVCAIGDSFTFVVEFSGLGKAEGAEGWPMPIPGPARYNCFN